MFDKLLDLLSNCFEFFLPFTVINVYERGVILRLGKFNRDLEPGFHWRWPLGIDAVLYDNVAARAWNLGAQSLTTRDGKGVVIDVVITAHIEDVRKALLDVEGVDDAIRDACGGAVGTHVDARTWDDLRSEDSLSKLTSACRRNAKQYGVYIDRVQITNLAPCRVYRLHNER